ncbi:MAG: ferrochelatase, partial [Mycobacterium leprae]
DIRRGHAPTPEQLTALQRRYEAIGSSRLNEITRVQVEGIARVLAQADDPVEYRVYGANKHWTPRIPDVVRQMAQDGIEQAVALVLAPQASKLSSGTYFEIVDAAVASLPDFISFTPVFGWHLEPGYIEALSQKVSEALTRFPESNREKLPVIFTCHSLPQRILTWSDPYPDQLQEIGRAVAERVGLQRIYFAYQSAGRTPDPWLGPDVRVKVRQLAEAGERSLLICPAGFLADHLEVRYDLDIELKQEADQLGVHLERTAMLNDDPLLLEALAGVVRRYAKGE